MPGGAGTPPPHDSWMIEIVHRTFDSRHRTSAREVAGHCFKGTP